MFQLVIEAVKGDKSNGYVALDDFLFDVDVEAEVCTIYPPEAEIGHTDTSPGTVVVVVVAIVNTQKSRLILVNMEIGCKDLLANR